MRNLTLMNIALLSKWNWRFAHEREAFWKQVISHKYGEEEGGWHTRAISGRYGVGLWKAIRKEWLFLNGRLAYQVSSGQRVRFWTDKWCGDSHFVSHSLLYFPSLCLRMLGCRMFGTPMVMGIIRLLFSQGRLMIGRLSWWSVFCIDPSLPSAKGGGR